jgi:hypothetical protein
VTGDEPLDAVLARDADALIARRPGIRVGVRTADCVPILIEAPADGACAAVHAGWRGLVAGVVEATVDALGARAIEPDALRAAIGPCIGPCCFEVGDEVAVRFDGFVVKGRAGARPHVDLPAAARAALRRAGVLAVDAGPVACTRCDPRRYHSYRRDGPGTPQHLSHIAVPALNE